MGMKSQQKEIGGRVYTVTQLPAMRATLLLPKLGKILGPGFGALLAAIKTGGKGLDFDGAGLGDTLARLFDGLTPEQLEKLIRDLFESATVQENGKIIPLMPAFDVLMQGQVLTVFKLLWFALEVNYGDFSDALAGLGIGKLAAGAFQSAMSNTSAGPSNG